MKKILVMFAMLMAMFMTAYASPPNVDKVNLINTNVNVNAGQNGLDIVGATAHASDVAFVKVHVLHKDILMPNSDNSGISEIRDTLKISSTMGVSLKIVTVASTAVG